MCCNKASLSPASLCEQRVKEAAKTKLRQCNTTGYVEYSEPGSSPGSTARSFASGLQAFVQVLFQKFLIRDIAIYLPVLACLA